MSWIQRIVAAMIAGLPWGIGAADVGLYQRWGNSATISRVFLSTTYLYPLVPCCLAYCLGVLLRHLSVPQFTNFPPPTAERVGRMSLVLSPAFYAMWILLLNDTYVDDAKFLAVPQRHWIMLSVAICGSFVAGYALGQFLPQHLPEPTPGEN